MISPRRRKRGAKIHKANHLPLAPQRLMAREVARTEARMPTVSTPMSTVISNLRGRERRDSTSSPRARCFSFRRSRSRGVRAKREVSVAAKKPQRRANPPRISQRERFSIAISVREASPPLV